MFKTYSDLLWPYRVVVAVTATLGAFLAATTLGELLSDGISVDFANKDFANYWIAGKLALDGQAIDLFGPQPHYFAHLAAAFGGDYKWHAWSYPPHYVLMIWPLGLFGYKTAMLLFLGVTGAFYAWSLRRFAGRANWMLALVASGPFILFNIWSAQNGFLTAGLALGALSLRDRRPVFAGMLIGLMTVKPQLGIMLPFLLLAERRWAAIVSAALTTAVLVGLSAAVFGIETWQGYLRETLPYQASVMRQGGGIFLSMMPSVYGSLRQLDFGAASALVGHLVVAVPIFLSTVAAFFMADMRWRGILLPIATFIVTPYALAYDLGMAVAAIALMAGPAVADKAKPGAWLQCLLAVAMLTPIWIVPIGAFWLPVAPAILVAVYLIALQEAFLREARPTPGPSPLERPSAA